MWTATASHAAESVTTLAVYETATLTARVPDGMVAIATNSGGRWFVVGERQSSGYFEERLGFDQPGTFDYIITAYPRRSPTQGADYTRPTELARYRLEVKRTIAEPTFWARVLARGRLPTAATAEADKAYDYTRIDAFARSVPQSALATPRSVARYLARGASNERELARAVFTWIHDNIRYEVTDVIDPDPVFVARKGQCAGMMLLYRDMAAEVGLVVHGVGGESGLSERGHAWNVVLIDGTWRLLDVTWGQFFVTPEEMAKSRFPISQYGVFSLLGRPFTRFDFYTALTAPPPEGNEIVGLRRIVSAHDGRCFAELPDGNVGLRECDGTPSERWSVEVLSAGAYRFTNEASGKALSLLGERRDVSGAADFDYPYYDEVGDRLGTTTHGGDKASWGLLALGPAGELTIYNRWSQKILSQQQHGGTLQQALQVNARSRFRLEPVSVRNVAFDSGPAVSTSGLALGYWPTTGRWYPVDVRARRAHEVDFTWRADGEPETVSSDRVRAFDWQVGLAVQCKWARDGLYYPATIASQGGDHLTVRWDEGGELQPTPLGACRSATSSLL
jgi:hypothetical protein